MRGEEGGLYGQIPVVQERYFYIWVYEYRPYSNLQLIQLVYRVNLTLMLMQ